MKCRNALTDVETERGRFLRDKHGNRPGSCPRGIRHLGGAKPDQALVWNVRTCRLDAKGDVQAAKSARTRVPMRDTETEGSVVGGRACCRIIASARNRHSSPRHGRRRLATHVLTATQSIKASMA